MVKYAKIIDGVVIKYPYDNLFKDNPNVSFAIPVDEETLNHFNTFIVHETDKPIINSSHTYTESTPIFEDGKWKTQWEVIAVQDKNLDQENLKNAWSDVRKQRDQMLRDSDWAMLPDTNTNKDIWAAYRNKLRRLPQTQDDPFTIRWPTPPEE